VRISGFIENFINNPLLEMLWKTSDNPNEVRSMIDIIRGKDSSDEQVESATAELMKIAEKKGLPSVIGDQLTYERASIGKQLRKGKITVIESFHLLRFRLAMFHALMAKAGLHLAFGREYVD
jgi:hypothetical protein